MKKRSRALRPSAPSAAAVQSARSARRWPLAVFYTCLAGVSQICIGTFERRTLAKPAQTKSHVVFVVNPLTSARHIMSFSSAQNATGDQGWTHRTTGDLIMN
ncbi:MAG TPA: hypothetical protein VHU21_24440, partial [Paraburkholderia sp.]|nr:hypothetical protein [Paraburkholderia sp.]